MKLNSKHIELWDQSNIFLTIFLLSPRIQTFGRKNTKITDFGAVADTNILSTQAIQKAIDLLFWEWRRTSDYSAGNYKAGTIILKSNVNFHLENGAVLYGGKSLNDYIKLKPEYISLRTQEATIQLIYAESVENVSITDFGEINGQGSGFKKLSWNERRNHSSTLDSVYYQLKKRYHRNISLKNSGCWI